MTSRNVTSTSILAMDETNYYNQTYSRSAPVVLDAYYGSGSGEAANALWVGVTGDVVLEGIDGVANVFENVPVGILRFKHIRILTGATIDLVAYTTSATNMVWMGGAK